MGVKCKKIINVSDVAVPIVIGNGTTLYLQPRGVVENLDVENYFEIEKFIKSEIDLTEIKPFPEPGKKSRKRVNLNE